LIVVQFVFGALTLLTLAPILMQIGHLLLADAIWIVFVLLSAEFLAEQNASPAVFSEAKSQKTAV
jgi:heme A synthase